MKMKERMLLLLDRPSGERNEMMNYTGQNNSSNALEHNPPHRENQGNLRSPLAARLIAFGTAGPVVFLVVATLLGLIQPGYDMASSAISELALGPLGWVQTANFYLTGLSFIAFAFGLYLYLGHRSRVARALPCALLVLSGIGLIISGIFPTDAPGAPETGTGALHNLAFLVTLFPLILTYPLAALLLRREPGFRAHALVTALMPLVVFGLMFVFVGFGSEAGDPLYGVGGLVQRALIVVAFGWITVTGWRLLARSIGR